MYSQKQGGFSMKKLSKKLLSVLTAAAMIFTVLATPIGEILGFTGEAVKASAATLFTGQVQTSLHSGHSTR